MWTLAVYCLSRVLNAKEPEVFSQNCSDLFFLFVNVVFPNESGIQSIPSRIGTWHGFDDYVGRFISMKMEGEIDSNRLESFFDSPQRVV